jgi:hypothetical protein
MTEKKQKRNDGTIPVGFRIPEDLSIAFDKWISLNNYKRRDGSKITKSGIFTRLIGDFLAEEGIDVTIQNPENEMYS